MKIILSNYRYFVSGGPERYLFSIQDYLRNRGHEVIPFSVKSSRNLPNEYESHFLSPIGDENSAYFSEYKKDVKTVLKVLERQTYSPDAFFKARSFAKKFRSDLVYSLHYLNKMSPAVLDGFKSTGLPIVVRISDFGLICPQAHFFDGKAQCTKCLDGNFFHAVGQRCIMESRTAGLVKAFSTSLHRLMRCNQRINAFVFPSRFTLERFVEGGFPREKLHLLPTSVDTLSITPSNLEGGNILYFGRVTAEKGVHHLLAAYRGIGGDKPKLIVIGAQAKEPFAKALMSEYREVEFHEFIPKEKLETHIRNALCVVIPSIWYDNLPNVLLESFAYGRPVIAPEHGCFPELITNGRTGFLYEPGSVQALQEKLAWAIANPTAMAEMGRNARMAAEVEFSPERHYDRLIAIFASVM